MLLIGEFAVTPNLTCFRLVYIGGLTEAKLAGCSCRALFYLLNFSYKTRVLSEIPVPYRARHIRPGPEHTSPPGVCFDVLIRGVVGERSACPEKLAQEGLNAA
jgi:hypothetical protein